MRVAVFDLDGTLADTSADLIAAANGALAEAGLGAPLDLGARPGGRLRRRPGDAARRAGARAGRGTRRRSTGSIRGCSSFYGAALAVQTRLYDGAEAALERLAADGWRLGICTNKPERLAVLLIEELGLGAAFRGAARGRQPAGAQARPAAPARDDRAGRRRAASGRCWSATPSPTAMRPGRPACPACWSASGRRAARCRRSRRRRWSRTTTSCRSCWSGWCRHGAMPGRRRGARAASERAQAA